MSFDGIEREYLQVDYAQGDRLYVPVHQADRLARYVGAGEARPPCTAWARPTGRQVKARAKKAVAEIADELLALYAAAQRRAGPRLQPRRAVAARAGGQLPLRRDRRPVRCHRSGQSTTWSSRGPWTA